MRVVGDNWNSTAVVLRKIIIIKMDLSEVQTKLL